MTEQEIAVAFDQLDERFENLQLALSRLEQAVRGYLRRAA